jgi:hypothetical protein
MALSEVHGKDHTLQTDCRFVSFPNVLLPGRNKSESWTKKVNDGTRITAAEAGNILGCTTKEVHVLKELQTISILDEILYRTIWIQHIVAYIPICKQGPRNKQRSNIRCWARDFNKQDRRQLPGNGSVNMSLPQRICMQQ